MLLPKPMPQASSCAFLSVILNCCRKHSGCGYFPPVHIFFIPIAVLDVEEFLGQFTIVQVRRVVLRHVPDVHRAVTKVFRDLFPDKAVRALDSPPPVAAPCAAACCSLRTRSRPLYPLTG